jgi:hypothetical protein
VKKKPEKIDLNGHQIDSLSVRIDDCNLDIQDKVIVKSVLQFYFWIQTALQESKISIKRLMSMFGFKKTESMKNLALGLSLTDEENSFESAPEIDEASEDQPENDEVSNQNAPEAGPDLLKKKT